MREHESLVREENWSLSLYRSQRQRQFSLLMCEIVGLSTLTLCGC